MKNSHLACTCLWLLLWLAASASPIETDTPSLANSSKTVGEGVFQLESGFLHTDPRRSGGAGEAIERSHASSPTLIRLGLTPDVELRFESEMLAVEGNQSGFSDVALGFKWTAAQNDQVSFGIIGMLTPPSGHAPFRTDAFTPRLTLATDFQLTPEQSITFNVGEALVENESKVRSFESFGALSYNVDLSDEWVTFAEVAVKGPQLDRQTFETIVDAGIGYRPSPNGIVNLTLFRGLSNQGMDWGVSLSFGLRT